MIKVATFILPKQEKEANEFLSQHKPSQNGMQFNEDRLFVFFDDGTYPATYQIADLQELLQSNRAAVFQQEIAMHVMKYEMSKLNRVKNAKRYEELDAAIASMKSGREIQNVKAKFVEDRIAELQTGDGSTSKKAA